MPNFAERALEESWHSIDQLVEEVAELSRSSAQPREFYGHLLSRLNALFSGTVASIWEISGRTWRVQHQIVEDQQAFTARQTPFPTFAGVSSSGRPAAFDLSDEESYLLGPVVLEGETVAIVEINLPARVSDAVRQNQLELLTATCDLAADYEARRRASVSGKSIDDYVGDIHRSLDLDRTCFAIANETRRLLAVERVSVLVRRGRHFRLRAVSGLDEFDRRSEEVRHLEQLGDVTAAGGEAIWFVGDSDDLPGPAERAIEEFIDHSAARTVIALPLANTPSDPAASGQVVCDHVLVLERFDAPPLDESDRELINAIARHTFPALRNATRYESIPRPIRALSSLASKMTRLRVLSMVLAFVTLAALSFAALTVQTDYEVRCHGELRPVETRHVFAPSDGVVERLTVAAGNEISKGDPLLSLSNSELEYERTRLEGDRHTSRGRLNAIRATLSSFSGADDRKQRLRLTGEQTLVQATIDNLDQQLEVIRARQADLQVTSPLTGTVLTANVRERLEGRPVRRGQRLLTVANVNGLWMLELRIDDHDVGRVRDALLDPQLGDGLEVVFLLAAETTQHHSATLSSVELATEIDEEHGVHVKARADIAQSESVNLDPRVGAGVVAKIHCGRRSIAYVWLHDLIDVIRTRLLF